MKTAPHEGRRAKNPRTGSDGADPAPAGTEWLIDAFGCDPDLLADVRHLEAMCAEVVRALDLRVVGEARWHQFPAITAVRGGSPALGGATGLYLLAESHLTCHTFPERRLATLNLYCCRSRPPFDWSDFLQRRLGARAIVVRAIPRGAVQRIDARPGGIP